MTPARRSSNAGTTLSAWAMARAALVGIAGGLAASVFGLAMAAAAAWAATAAAGIVVVAVSTLKSLRQGKVGVDVIALLALVGALLLQEYLAGAVIALMFTGGEALERYANTRAKRELSRLLDRAPKIVHRYQEEALSDVSVAEVKPDDRLMVKPGEVVPVDGVLAGPAVLDESALTGESQTVTRKAGEEVRSGGSNAASQPFEMRATGSAEESTYAGHCPPGIGGAEGESAAHAPRRSLCIGVPASHPRRSGACLGPVGEPGPCPGGAGDCHALPPHTRGSRGDHRRHLQSGTGRDHRKRGRRSRSPLRRNCAGPG